MCAVWKRYTIKMKRSGDLSKVIKLFLIRHARQNSPLCNVNVSLADEGLLQSMLLGQRLREYHIDKVYSSDLTRAVMTADIIRCEINRKMIREKNMSDIHKTDCDKILKEISELNNKDCEYEELRETDFGELTGLPDSILRVKYADYFADRDLKLEDVRIPGGENGEEVYLRMNRAMNSIIKDAVKNNYENVAVVSHGGAIRCYLAGILGMPQSHRFTIAKNMENTSITEIHYNTEKAVYSVERINDYAHLEGYEELLRKNFK